MLVVPIVLLFLSTIQASPFQLTERYIEDFKAGIVNLEKLAESYQYQEQNFDPSIYNETDALREAEHYDFIIIGAGASGSVIANRLSEVPEWKILLLEAGGPETEFTQVPKLARIVQGTHYNWHYLTTPQKNWCLGMKDQSCQLEAGKGLGGSTILNGMVYTRGNAKDYDQWADLGNDGWCYKDVLPFFKKAEDAHLKHFDHKYHNHGGPFHIENPQYHTEVLDNSLEAAKSLGYEIVDYNGEKQLGFGALQTNTKNGKRQSTGQAYLKPAKERKNLTIRPYSHVIKIIISPHTKVAEGVKYLHDGKLLIAKAEKEVILSAGPINSPQLLQLSGVGPKELLEKFDINQIADLNVGHNLKEHISFIGLDFYYNHTKDDEKEADLKQQIIEYLKDGKGPLSAPGTESLGYIKTPNSKLSHEQPDVELFFYPKKFSTEKPLFRIKKETVEALWKPIENKNGFGIGVMLAHPKSTGSVVIKDKDPLHHPLIDPNQLSDSDNEDLNTLVAGIRKAIELGTSEQMKAHGITLNEHKINGCDNYEFNSDDYWKCAVKHLSICLRHITGTVKMGPNTDKDAIVDNNLKVYGVERLRVADSSVIPVTITGHTMAASIMIGEKASDLIKHHWK